MPIKKKLLIAGVEQFGYFTSHFYAAHYLKEYFEIEYICLDLGYSKIEETGIKIIYLKGVGKIKRLLNFLFTTVRISNTGNYSALLVSNNNKMIYLVGIFVYKPIKILDICTGDLSYNRLKRKYKNFLIYFTSLFFDKKLIISESLQNLLGIKNANTYIVPIGANIMDNHPKTYDRLHLLYLGTIDKRNIEKTIEGLFLFRQKYNNEISINYDIIGSGKPLAIGSLLKSIESHKMQDIIHFHGRKDNGELPDYFRNATIGVCFVPLTDYYDVQPPTKLFEYSFSGLINIATDTYENRRFITNDNGIICKDNSQSFAEALESVYRFLSSYDEQKIRSSLSEYSWEKIVTSHLYPIINDN